MLKYELNRSKILITATISTLMLLVMVIYAEYSRGLSISKYTETEVITIVTNDKSLDQDIITKPNSVSTVVVNTNQYKQLALTDGIIYIREIVVKKGDTLYGIAKKYDVDYSKIQNLNQIDNADLIFAGTTLYIPVKRPY